MSNSKSLSEFIARNSASNALSALYESTRNLHARFDVELTPEIARRVFREEAGELCDESVMSEIGDMSIASIAEETVDVFVTAMVVAMAHGLTLENIERAMLRVIAKNDAKTTETHAINAQGKIARKAVQG